MLISKRSAPTFAQRRSGISTGINDSLGLVLEGSAHSLQAATVSSICDDFPSQNKTCLVLFHALHDMHGSLVNLL